VGLVDGLAILVQSPNYDPEEIDFYIEECLGYFENYLSKLSDRDFGVMKEALKKELQ
jgi:secreted Zn-dependent insulinase-like peptidase